MKHFEIESAARAERLGVFASAHRAAALNAYARHSGYRSYVEMLRALPGSAVAATEVRAYEHARAELVVVDVLCGAPRPGSDAASLLEAGELANEICRLADPSRCAPDYTGPVGGGSRDADFNVVVLKSELDAWRAAAARFGARVVARGAPLDGHYGDAQWHGVDIMAVPGRPGRVYWIER